MRVRGSVFPEEKEGMEYLSREWKSDWTLTYGLEVEVRHLSTSVKFFPAPFSLQVQNE